jgi:GT2 family glycosyltransferase
LSSFAESGPLRVLADSEHVPALVPIIATSGRPELLKRTLESLGKCTLPASFAEAIVVENGPASGSREIVESGPAELKLRYLYFAQGNKSAALNAALETLGDCLIFFTDDDVRVDGGVLTAYAEAAAARGPGHFFGGPVGADYDTPPPQWLLNYLPRSATGWEAAAENFSEASHEFLGFNWAAFSGDVREAGGFNPNRGPGALSGSTGQESDMQRRLVARGIGSVYVPGARVWHFVPPDRCSPQWAIERAYRHGVEEGTKWAHLKSRFPGLLPRRVVRRRVVGIVKSILWMLCPDAKVRFRGRYRLSFDRGLVRGWRQQTQSISRAGKPNI